MNIHFIKTSGELSETLVPEEDYYEEHSAESLYLMLSDMVSSDHQKSFTLAKTRELLAAGRTCVVMVKELDSNYSKIFIIPEPVRKMRH